MKLFVAEGSPHVGKEQPLDAGAEVGAAPPVEIGNVHTELHALHTMHGRGMNGRNTVGEMASQDDIEIGGESAGDWSRRLARDLFNRTWELIEKPDRTGDEDVEMLLCAMASRWHWGEIGGSEPVATGDWQVAHVASLLGLGELAVTFAKRHLASALDERWDGWRLASAYEGMARACAALGDAAGLARHYAEAEAALAHEPDEDDRAVIESQLATIPRG